MSKSSFVDKSMEYTSKVKSKLWTKSESSDAAAKDWETRELTSSSLDNTMTSEGPADRPIFDNIPRAWFSSSREFEIGIYRTNSVFKNDYFLIYLEEVISRSGLKCRIGLSAKEARASVIVLGKDSLTSIGQLKNLLESLEERRNSNHFVLPVFYHIEPSYIIAHGKDLMLQSFQGSPQYLEKVDQWHAALMEVATLPGISFSRWSRNDDDMASIREIVSILKHALYPSPVGSPSHQT